MQQMEWRDGKLQPRSSKPFLARILAAQASGMSSSEFVAQEIRSMQCEYCRRKVPIGPDGDHVLLGVSVPCYAE